MLEESNSEVTSSSAGLIMSPSIALSPDSLGSPEYSDMDNLLYCYDDNPLHSSHTGHTGITNGNLHQSSALGATNLNGMHNHLHGTNGGTVFQANNGHLHGTLMNGVGAAHINRLAQGMVNEILAANGGNGLGLNVDLMSNGGGVGGGVAMIGSNMTSSRSSTSPSIGKGLRRQISLRIELTSGI